MVQTFPSLTRLHVSAGYRACDQPLSYAVLEPIISQYKLRHFGIDHPAHLDLTQADVVKIAEAWGPTIEVLSLSPRPQFMRTQNVADLDLHALEPIALHCHRLQKLGIFLDTRVPIELPSHSLPHRFSDALKEFDFGYSLVGLNQSAAFLGLLACPTVDVRIKGSDRSPYYESGYNTREAGGMMNVAAWGAVESAVNGRDRSFEALGGSDTLDEQK